MSDESEANRRGLLLEDLREEIWELICEHATMVELSTAEVVGMLEMLKHQTLIEHYGDTDEH